MKETFYKYLSDEADDWGCKIVTCGYNHAPAGKEYPEKGHPQSHDFTWEEGRILEEFYLIYIPTGSGSFETECHQYEVNSGDAMLIYENEWHRYRPDKKTGWEEYWIGFDGSYLRNHIVSDLFPDQKSYLKKIGYQEDILILFNQFLELSAKNSLIFKKMLLGCLLQLLAHFATESEKKIQTNRNSFIVERTIHIIRQHIKDDIDFRELAQLFHISYSHFRKIFKEITGFSPHQFLINERIECAKRLLVNTELNIKEIAQNCGFKSIHYFSRIFKQKTGSSPSFRRKNYH